MSDPTHPQYPDYPGGDQPPPPGNEPPPPGATYGYGAPGWPQANQMALWSMISGIASIPLLCLCGTGFFAGIAALALGLVSKGQIDKSRGMQTGSGQALAGIILGSITIALAVVYMIVMFTLGFTGSFSSY